MKKKIVALALVATMVGTVLAGCGAKKEEKKVASGDEKIKATMTVWGPSEDQSKENGNWMEKMCEKFAKEHPNWDLSFKYSVCPESDAKQMVTQDPEAAADVYLYANDNLTALLSSNAISKIGGKAAEYVKTTNAPNIVNSVIYKGDIYGFPFTGNTWFMYYDKRTFTDDDIKSLDKMLSKGTVAFPVSNSWFLPSFFFANGCTLFGDGSDESKGVEFGGEKGKAATDYVIDMVANPNFKNDSDGSGLSGLRDGSVKAIFSGSWDYQAVKEALGDNLGVAKLPKITENGKELQLKSYAGSKAVGVNPHSKNPQVAVALAQFLASPEAQKAHYELRNIIPCNTDVLKDEVFKKDALVKAQNETMEETSVMQPFVSKMDNVWMPMENYGKAILNHEVTHENALEMVNKLNENCNKSASK